TTDSGAMRISGASLQAASINNRQLRRTDEGAYSSTRVPPPSRRLAHRTRRIAARLPRGATRLLPLRPALRPAAHPGGRAAAVPEGQRVLRARAGDVLAGARRPPLRRADQRGAQSRARRVLG